ncbi:hypothetical protein [Nocardia sp. NPDC051463]|uniref:hypothetical protein n=1 Tax=Nocardia sp. NPDC051463 TaxID=3154845 RepID=UPI00344DB6B6
MSDSGFWIGDRIEYDPADYGVALPPVPPGIELEWSRDPAPDWEVTIGEAGGANP